MKEPASSRIPRTTAKGRGMLQTHPAFLCEVLRISLIIVFAAPTTQVYDPGPAPEPRPAPRPAAPEPGFAERAAEAAFAARVARGAYEHPGSVGQRADPELVQPRLSRNDDFNGLWMDDTGKSYELQQVGSVVTEQRQQSYGMAMQNELTMFGAIGTLVDDLIRWSDGSVWAREATTGEGGSSGPHRSGANLGSLGGFAWKAAARRQRLAPELPELFTAPAGPGPGPDMSGDWEETKQENEQRLWFAPWVHEGKRGL